MPDGVTPAVPGAVPASLPWAQVRIGKVWIDSLSFDDAVDAVAALIERRAGGLVFTPNVDHVLLVDRDGEFRGAYDRARVVLADGMPLVWAASLLRTPLPAKVSGSDLLMPLMERSAVHRWRVFLVGGAPGVSDEAANKLRLMGVDIVGAESPRLSARGVPDDADALHARIRAACPDLVLGALGSPKQELWLAKYGGEFEHAVGIGVGASLDFLVGRVRRAPRWVSSAGFEWLYRLLQEPRRLWRRYLVRGPSYLMVVLRALVTPRDARFRSAGSAPMRQGEARSGNGMPNSGLSRRPSTQL